MCVKFIQKVNCSSIAILDQPFFPFQMVVVSVFMESPSFNTPFQLVKQRQGLAYPHASPTSFLPQTVRLELKQKKKRNTRYG